MRSIRSFTNSSVSFIFLILNAGLGFAAMRIYIHSFSSELNGLLSALTSVITYFNVVEAGLSAAITFMYYKPLADQDYAAVARLYKGSRKILNRISLIMAILLITGACIFPVLIRNNPFSYNFVLSVFLLTGFSTVIENFLINPFVLLLNADQKGYVYSIALNTAKIVFRLAGLIYLYYGGNILVFLTYSYIALFVSAWFFHSYRLRHYQYLNGKHLADKSALGMTKYVMLNKVATLVVYNTDTLILTFFLSLRDASVYSVYNGLYCIFLKNGLGALYSAITPSLGNLFVDRPERSAAVISMLETFIVVTAGIGFVGLFYLQYPLISFIADKSYIDPLFSILFLLMCYLDILRTPALMITSASGLFKETKLAPIIEITLNLPLSIILVKVMGIYGVIVATIITYIIYLLVFYPMVYKLKELTYGKLFLKVILNLGIVLLLVFSKFTLSADTSFFLFLVEGTLVMLIVAGIFGLVNWLFFRKDFTALYVLLRDNLVRVTG